MSDMKYGLIGGRLGHSFSKVIHEKIGGYDYELKEISAENLDSFMRAKDFLGINVTIPYKEAVIPYLDYVDSAAEKIGAVNIVINREGKLYGYNTDFSGMKLMIEKNGFGFRDAKILILGSGGTAKTSAAVAEALGAKEIVTVSRSGEVNYENVASLHSDADFIINTTPCGMYPENDTYALDPADFPDLKGIVDAVYNPLKTALVQKGEEKGFKGVTGLYMLVAQAVCASELFKGEGLDTKKTADKIYADILREKRNIVLVGMPGSGKSTVGKKLAGILDRDFADTDDMITRKYGVISDIFAGKGEAYFRDRETEQVKEISKKNGLVIATGGGAILRKENVDALRQNGVIFFLDRPLEDIVPTSDRPLSSDAEALKKRYNERYELYIKASDFHIKADGDIADTVGKIKRCL